MSQLGMSHAAHKHVSIGADCAAAASEPLCLVCGSLPLLNEAAVESGRLLVQLMADQSHGQKHGEVDKELLKACHDAANCGHLILVPQHLQAALGTSAPLIFPS